MRLGQTKSPGHAHGLKSFMKSKIALMMIAIIVAQALVIRWLLSISHTNAQKCGQEMPHLQNRSMPVELKAEAPEIAQLTKLKGQEIHQLSTIEIFRRFALLAPAPSKTPYMLANPHATYYSDSNLQQDRKIDELLKQRERGFFIEVVEFP